MLPFVYIVLPAARIMLGVSYIQAFLIFRVLLVSKFDRAQLLPVMATSYDEAKGVKSSGEHCSKTRWKQRDGVPEMCLNESCVMGIGAS